MRLVALSLSLVVLAGCASTAPQTQVDEKYVARAELSARLGGAQIVWVNMPRRPVDPAEAAAPHS